MTARKIARLAFMSKMPGPISPAFAIHAERHPFQRPPRPDRIEMAEHQGRPQIARVEQIGPRRGRRRRVGNDLDRGPDLTQSIRQQRSQSVERRLSRLGDS